MYVITYDNGNKAFTHGFAVNTLFKKPTLYFESVPEIAYLNYSHKGIYGYAYVDEIKRIDIYEPPLTTTEKIVNILLPTGTEKEKSEFLYLLYDFKNEIIDGR